MAKNYMKQKMEKKNSERVEEIKNGSCNLKDKIKKISEEEIENKKPNQILETVSDIIDFNKKNLITRRFRFKNTNTKPNAL